MRKRTDGPKLVANQQDTAKAPKRTGRPPMPFDPAIGSRICELVSLGSNLAKIVQDEPGMVSLDTVYKWFQTDAAFAEMYARARLTRADSRADKLDEIVAKTLAGEIDANVARVVIDAIKWQMSKENVLRYGDRSQVDMSVTEPVDTVLSDARKRLAAARTASKAS